MQTEKNIEERRETFIQLYNRGHSLREITEITGYGKSTVGLAIKGFVKPRYTPRAMTKPSIDLGLALLSALNNPAMNPLTNEEVAAWCGCTRQAIDAITQGAFQKIKRQFPELIEYLEEAA